MADWGRPGGGGIFYEPSMLQIDSGTFWRCHHGRTKLNGPCWPCALRHPLLALRWYYPRAFRWVRR